MNYPLRRRLPVLSLQETFLRLAQMTTPHGYEAYCWPLLPLQDSEHYIDEKGNVHIWVRRDDDEYSPVMWSSHLDTADYGKPKVVSFRRTKKGKISTDGKTILGADCKIGAAIMIKMIEARVPGWYVFHAGEEKGLIGARYNAVQKWPYEPDFAIAFDRKDRNEIITFQGGTRCASDKFAEGLAAVLNTQDGFQYKASPDGVFTDTHAYVRRIRECTNLGVGYFKQHTNEECQDILHAEMLLDVIIRNRLLFDDLPCPRDPKKDNESRYQHTSWNSGNQYANKVYRDGKWVDKDDASPKANGSGSTTKNDDAPDLTRTHSDDERRYMDWWQANGKTRELVCAACGADDEGYAACSECGHCKFKYRDIEPKTEGPTKMVYHCPKCRTVEMPDSRWSLGSPNWCSKCNTEMEYIPCPHPNPIPDGNKGRMICDDCDKELCGERPVLEETESPPCSSLAVVTNAKMTAPFTSTEQEENTGCEQRHDRCMLEKQKRGSGRQKAKRKENPYPDKS